MAFIRTTEGTGNSGLRRNVQDRINASVYHAPDITRHYSVLSLNVAESAALLKFSSAWVGGDVLDIGVGTGRTTRALRPAARHYVGIDYSRPMVDYMHRFLPDAEIHLADMRDLSRWDDQSFDLVFAPNNVFDAVAHGDRLQVLREARRVLRYHGVLVFSGHNRNAPPSVARTEPTLELSRNPAKQLFCLRAFMRQRGNYRRLRPFFYSGAEYALQADIGHDFGCLHYYIDPGAQRRQVEAAGYEVLDAIGSGGTSIAQSEPAADHSSIMYVVRKPRP